MEVVSTYTLESERVSHDVWASAQLPTDSSSRQVAQHGPLPDIPLHQAFQIRTPLTIPSIPPLPFASLPYVPRASSIIDRLQPDGDKTEDCLSTNPAARPRVMARTEQPSPTGKVRRIAESEIGVDSCDLETMMLDTTVVPVTHRSR